MPKTPATNHADVIRRKWAGRLGASEDEVTCRLLDEETAREVIGEGIELQGEGDIVSVTIRPDDESGTQVYEVEFRGASRYVVKTAGCMASVELHLVTVTGNIGVPLH